ncbi:MAG: hypothetical protein LBQ65_02635 [Tannerellaceae bacterium]|jgi:hypothetical protein|nr:hypothetical protein [Tannerellaceae bacterium]
MQQTVQQPLQRSSFQGSITRQETSEQALSGNKRKQKDDACDFFTIDIYHIFKHEPEFVEKYEDDYGQTVEKYTLKLNTLELSVFNQVNILRYENGDYDLLFTSNSNVVSSELKDFVAYCADVLGPDFMQKRQFNDEDVRDLRLGIFSRVWRREIRIENVYFTLSLSLYGIPAPKA